MINFIIFFDQSQAAPWARRNGRGKSGPTGTRREAAGRCAYRLKVIGTLKDQEERPASAGISGNGEARRTASSAAWSMFGSPELLAMRMLVASPEAVAMVVAGGCMDGFTSGQ